ncbi:MAG: tetratricopeptide repeat protein, partial [Candidatus Hodarchaeota archaeon]
DCLATFAFYYYSTQRASEGISHAREALEIARSLDHPALLSYILNIAAILAGNAGNFTEQVALYREAIELQRMIVKENPDSPRQRAFLAALLGNMTLSINDENEIIKIYKEVFEIREDTVDISPEGLALAKMNYGWFCLRMLRFQEAIESLKEAKILFNDLEEERAKYSEEYSAFTDFLLAEAVIFSEAAAESLKIIDSYSRMIQVIENPVTDLHIIAVSFSGFLHSLYNLMNFQQNAAEEQFQRSVELIERLVIDTGEEVLVVSAILNNYGCFLTETERHTKASEMLNRAKEATEIYFGSLLQSFLAGLIDANIGLVLQNESKYNESEEKYRNTLTLLENYIKHAPKLITTRIAAVQNNYSLLHRKQGNMDEAINTIQRAIEIKRELAETNSNFCKASLAISLNNLGIMLNEADRGNESIQVLKEALEIRRELAESVPDVHSIKLASTLHNMSIALFREGKDSASRKLFDEAFEIRSSFTKIAPDMVSEFMDFSFEEIIEKSLWSEDTEPIYLTI